MFQYCTFVWLLTGVRIHLNTSIKELKENKQFDTPPMDSCKLDKWHLAKIMGSWGFYVRRLQLDPCPHVDVVWQKKRGFLVTVLTSCAHTLCIFPENCKRYEYILLHLRIFINFVFAIYFDQGRRSCPGASCSFIFPLLAQKSTRVGQVLEKYGEMIMIYVRRQYWSIFWKNLLVWIEYRYRP